MSRPLLRANPDLPRRHLGNLATLNSDAYELCVHRCQLGELSQTVLQLSRRIDRWGGIEESLDLGEFFTCQHIHGGCLWRIERIFSKSREVDDARQQHLSLRIE